MNVKISATFVIFFILFSLMLLVAIPFIYYIKKIKIKDCTARKLEIIGYYILFVIIIWEFGMKNIMLKEFDNLDITYLGEKIDLIFLWVRNNVEGKNVADILPEYYDVGVNNQYVEFQLLVADIIEMILQITSTVLIAIGRFQELISKADK